MALRAGTKSSATDEYTNSMAEAMEKAFLKEWPAIMGSDPPKTDNQVRLLFIAIAQGVIRHLKNNENSITVTVPTIGIVPSNIATDGTLH